MSSAAEQRMVELRHVSKLYRIQRERASSFLELFAEGFRPWRRREYREIWALRDVSLGVSQGETVGIIGPNGAGKSTVLKLIARVLEPTGGEIVARGRVSSLLELGTGFHPDLTGRDNVFLYGSLLGFSRREMARRFDNIVEFSGIGGVIDMPVKRYSSGMYLRLAFSVAIHVEPDVLLVDEVFAVGDQSFQERCLRRVQKLQHQGVTILFVSHNMETVRQMCTRALWLDQGNVRADGPAEQVVEWYLNEAASQDKLFQERAQEKKGSRWGTKDVKITRVYLLDPQGRECEVVPTGGSLRIRVEFVAHRRIERPVFGIAIYREDGVHVNGPNTRLAGLDIEQIEGPGVLEYRVDRLSLLPGNYNLSVAIHDWDGLRSYDHWHQAVPFVVGPGETEEIHGLVWMPSHWRLVCGDIEREAG